MDGMLSRPSSPLFIIPHAEVARLTVSAHGVPSGADIAMRLSKGPLACHIEGAEMGK